MSSFEAVKFETVFEEKQIYYESYTSPLCYLLEKGRFDLFLGKNLETELRFPIASN